MLANDRSRIIIWCLGGYLLALAAGIAFALALQNAGNWRDGLPWEHDVLRAVNGFRMPVAIDWMLLIVPWFGTNITLLPAVIVATILLERRGRHALALHLMIMQLGTFTMNPLLKEFFDRPRPALWEMRGQYAWASYPSGHAIASVASLFTIAILLRRERGWGWPFPAAMAMLVITAYSRLYLGVHWPTDVIGGLIMGAIWLAATLIAFRPAEPRIGDASGAGARVTDGSASRPGS